MIFRLGIPHTKGCVGVRLAVHVRHAPLIALDRDAIRRACRRLGRKRERPRAELAERNNENQATQQLEFHGLLERVMTTSSLHNRTT